MGRKRARDVAQARVRPAQQGLGADGASVLEAHGGLVQQVELLGFGLDGVPQIVLQFEGLGLFVAQAHVEQLHLPAPLAFGVLQGHLGVTEGLVGVAGLHAGGADGEGDGH